MDETYGQQICLHPLTTRMQLMNFCKKLQQKWSPTPYYHMVQIMHFEKLKLNDKLIIFLMKFIISIIHIKWS
jgi:hypothetical protein